MPKVSRNVGWIKQRDLSKDGKFQVEPIKPTAFENLSARLGIPVTDAVKNPVIVLWIRANFCRRYVPEQILDDLGLQLSERQLGMDVTRERGQ
jgi:hypothetical protein